MTALDDALRALMRTTTELGHIAATNGIPRAQAINDVVNSPEADQLLAMIGPSIRAAAQEATP